MIIIGGKVWYNSKIDSNKYIEVSSHQPIGAPPWAHERSIREQISDLERREQKVLDQFADESEKAKEQATEYERKRDQQEETSRRLLTMFPWSRHDPPSDD